MKTSIKLILLVSLLMLPYRTLALEFAKDGLSYSTLSENTAEVVGYYNPNPHSYIGYDYGLTIPSTVSYDGIEYSIIRIGSRAFYKNSYDNDMGHLISLNVPNSIQQIGDEAFRDCKAIFTLNLPNLTSIGNRAFSNSSLKNITMSSSVAYIETAMFERCMNLQKIVVQNGSTQNYDSRDNCNAIIETATNKLIVGCKSSTIPNTVTAIGNSAFSWCTGLTEITIPNTVTSIGGYAFYNCTGLLSVTLSESLSTIGAAAFKNCSSLSSVTLPNTLTSIASQMFMDCIGLQSVNFGNAIESIASYAFSGCSSLMSIVIPPTLKRIDASAFTNCTGIQEVHIYDLDAWCYIQFQSNPMGYGARLFINGSEISQVTIPEGITDLTLTFQGCESLTGVVFPNSLQTIGNSTFDKCINLTSAQIPNSVSSIGKKAFSCTKITTIEIPNRVTKIEEETFSNCRQLSNITLGSNIVSIGDKAFYNCQELKEITLPETMESLGKEVFSQSGISKLTCFAQRPPEALEKGPTVDAGTFDGINPYACMIYVPKDFLQSYWTAIGWRTFRNIKEIGTDNPDNPDLPVYGDVNGDKKVDVLDVNYLVNIIVCHISPVDVEVNDDINGDGKVDILDLNDVVNIILGKYHF